MKLPTRQAIVARFLDRPLMLLLVRGILSSRRLQFCIAAALFLTISGAILVTPLWRVSPPEVKPAVRISLLDRAQSYALERSANRYFASGNAIEGLAALQLAIANNPGSQRLVRQFLAQAADGTTPLLVKPLVNHGLWLLRLSGANYSDLELVATFWEKAGADEPLALLLAAFPHKNTPALQQLYSRNLIARGLLNEYDAFVLAFPSARSLNEPIANLRYSLLVADQFEQPDEYLAKLALLERINRDRPVDHARGWQLLQRNGRAREALALAESYTRPPQFPSDALLLAETCRALGASDAARAVLESTTRSFPDFAPLWILHSNLLIESKQWHELRALIARTSEYVNGPQALLNAYLQGLLEHLQHQPNSARNAFHLLVPLARGEPELALLLTHPLLDLGYADIAELLLNEIEARTLRNPRFWHQRAATAFALKNADQLLRAATKAMSLSPRDPVARNNYAAALLFTRADPQTAIALTLQLISRYPFDPAVQLNHAMALFQNSRTTEAEQLLARIDANKFTASQLNLYHLACTETLAAQNRLDLARTFAASIDHARLFPLQRQFLASLSESADSERAVHSFTNLK